MYSDSKQFVMPLLCICNTQLPSLFHHVTNIPDTDCLMCNLYPLTAYCWCFLTYFGIFKSTESQEPSASVRFWSLVAAVCFWRFLAKGLSRGNKILAAVAGELEGLTFSGVMILFSAPQQQALCLGPCSTRSWAVSAALLEQKIWLDCKVRQKNYQVLFQMGVLLVVQILDTFGRTNVQPVIVVSFNNQNHRWSRKK